jgi:type II restriction enzyme
MFTTVSNRVPFLAAHVLAKKEDFQGEVKVRLTAANIVKAIMGLPKGQWYEYITPVTRTQVRVLRTGGPEGPIYVQRRNPKISGTSITTVSLSSQMIWRIANAYVPGVPINFDRVLGASYNTRAVLETLLAHTSEFYWCRPGRIELINNSSEIKMGHKHLVWFPDKPHPNGILVEFNAGNDQAISEIPLQTVTYDSLAVTTLQPDMEIAVKRRHLQIQIALIEIGQQLGFRTWIAHNDKGFQYGATTVGKLPGVLPRLSDVQWLYPFDDAIDAAMQIDCIWFKNGKLMPAVMEVEHTTGITSGLTRMKKFQDAAPPLAGIRWVIVAADEDRKEVIRKANVAQFASLDVKYFAYSAVEELYSLCKRRKITNQAVNEDFLNCFMEPVSAAALLN